MKEKLLMTGSMLIFGSIGVIVRHIPLTSGQIALWRGTAGCLFLLLIIWLQKHRTNWKQIKENGILLLISGAAIGVNWIFLFQAYRYTTISNATLAYYVAPLIVVAASPLVLRTKFRIRQLISVVMGLCGLFFIIGFEKDGAVGSGYGLLAAVFYAMVVLTNKFIHHMSGLEITVFQLGAATIVLFPYIVFVDGFSLPKLSIISIICLLLIGIVHTGAAYFMYFTALQKSEAATAAIFSYIDPLFAVFLSVVLLGDTMTWKTIIGGLLIFSALLIQEIKSVGAKRESNT